MKQGKFIFARPMEFSPLSCLRQFVTTHRAAAGADQDIGPPVVRHHRVGVAGLGNKLARRFVKHHGIAAANVLHQGVGKAGRLFKQGRQADAHVLRINNARARAIQSGHAGRR